MKTSELTGSGLDWAVALIEKPGIVGVRPDGKLGAGGNLTFSPSTDWSQGGPIIERERIATGFDGYDDIDIALPIWSACKYVDGFESYGPTPLIAAMRCYVASKLGDTINIPKELK